MKWAVTDRFHEYLYGGSFDVYTDNNLLTYILKSAKLDAKDQRWVASLAPYNFDIRYNPGWQNVVADSLSQIPWGNVLFQDMMDFNIMKAVVNKGQTNSVAMIEPSMLQKKLMLQVHQLVDKLASQMTKTQWKEEQRKDPEIGPVMQLVIDNKHLQYKVEKTDSAGSKVLLRFHDKLRLVNGLLYRKWIYKEEITYLQFVLPKSFRKRMVMACHNQFGHFSMDKTLVLLQERFSGQK